MWRSQEDELGACYGATSCTPVSPGNGTSLGVAVQDGLARVVEVSDHPGMLGYPTTALRYIPHGNGIAPTGYQGQITDHDDAPTMSDNMCSPWDLVGKFQCCLDEDPSQCSP